MQFARYSALMLGASLLLGTTGAHAGSTVEVLHWWTSGGEAKAVGTLKEEFEAQGGTWIDSPIAGGGGDAAMTALRARVVAGKSAGRGAAQGPRHPGMGQ